MVPQPTLEKISLSTTPSISPSTMCTRLTPSRQAWQARRTSSIICSPAAFIVQHPFGLPSRSGG